ncbi:MAG: hydroxymethylbilane synthase [Phycisphaerae bacterium]
MAMPAKPSQGCTGRVIVGTRASRLALAQTAIVVDLLKLRHPKLDVELRPITTRGDRASAAGEQAPGAKGEFTTELEQALLEGRIDLAVHSAKDLPGAETAGLVVAAVPCRADPRDALISRDGLSLADLPAGAGVGTSSPRRRAELLHLRPDLVVRPLRGNVDTRVGKVAAGQYDAIVLAKAGLERVGLADQIVDVLAVETMVPAAGQGTLAVQVRVDDEEIGSWVSPLNDDAVNMALGCERAVAARLAGGCLAPIGVLAEVALDQIELTAAVLAPDGQGRAYARCSGQVTDRDGLVDRLVEDLRRQGADDLILARGAAPHRGSAG